jgi:hypothetical protein
MWTFWATNHQKQWGERGRRAGMCKKQARNKIRRMQKGWGALKVCWGCLGAIKFRKSCLCRDLTQSPNKPTHPKGGWPVGFSAAGGAPTSEKHYLNTSYPTSYGRGLRAPYHSRNSPLSSPRQLWTAVSRLRGRWARDVMEVAPRIQCERQNPRVSDNDSPVSWGIQEESDPVEELSLTSVIPLPIMILKVA